MSSEVGLFWLLLPLAAGLSWYFARRGSERQSGAQVNRLRSSYFRGLNYLLNEQQDKAIEVFLQIAEVDSDTVETHLALGNLFRRRGEVDRAIRVHENLIARPTLSAEQKTAAVLELGEDYMRAGLLDRAEALFTDLVALEARAPSALKHLIGIYQQERDWHKAIDHARRLERLGGESQGQVIAHYYCELAEAARLRRDREGAERALAEAFLAEPECVRGTLIQGRLSLDAGAPEAALSAFQRVVERDLEFVPELLGPALACFEKLEQPQAARDFLRSLIDRYPGISPVLALTRVVEREEGDRAAIALLTRELGKRPSVRGLAALIGLSLKGAEGEARENLLILDELTRKLLSGQAIYRCSRCGFGARAHHWQCPSCKNWGTVKPIHGVAGD
jgi:lipopolysaccharide biosynthesis regulator YciM